MTEEMISRRELQVKGMTCSNCALSVENFLKGQGLKEIAIDLGEGEVSFEWVESEKLPNIVKGISKLGFEVKNEDEEENWWNLKTKLILSSIFTIPLLLHMFLAVPLLHNPWFQLIMATPVFIIGMLHFGKSAYFSLKSGIPNMDVLISLGAIAAFGYSLYGTMANMGPDFLFYETAASILTIVLIGNYLEHRSIKQTTTAIRSLSRLNPEKAHRWRNFGKSSSLETVPLKEIVVGDYLQVAVGERIPLDGTIVKGQAWVDESMITGESREVDKEIGDKVIGGTIMNDGLVTLKVEKTGKDTILSQIIEMVKKAQADKPAVQRLADRISSVFVPAVITIAAITFVVSATFFDLGVKQSLIHAVAVLVISCPCAMGLATPTAVVVGIGRASQKGILVKGGSTLEAFSKIKRVVFDKTGTLTTGNFSINKMNGDQAALIEYAGILRAMSFATSHPKAKLLNQILPESGGEESHSLEISEIKGKGILAKDSGSNEYFLGSHRIWEERPEEVKDLYFTINKEEILSFELEDEIVEGAAKAVYFLHQQGIETVMLSGDNKSSCEKVAKALGIKTVYSEKLPGEKLEWMDNFIKESPTAMVGDGINDAPAMSRANVGISVRGGTDIAMQSAEIILLNKGVAAIPDLFKIGEHTVMTIKQNLFWAFVYNVLAIPLAAAGFLSPIIGAFTMAVSDVLVIGNSLRLKIKRLV